MAVKRYITEAKFDRRAREAAERLAKSNLAFKNDTPEAKRERIARGRDDILFFCQTYLGHWFRKESAPFHKDWAEDLKIINQPVIECSYRGSGKSTFFTVADTIHDLVYNLEPFTVIVSETELQAANFVQAIRFDLERNNKLKADFGDLRPKRGDEEWSDEAFGTKHGDYVLARGWDQQVRGLIHGPHRPTKIKIDDFENNKSAKSREIVNAKIKKIMGEYWKAFTPDRPKKMFYVNSWMGEQSCSGHYLSKNKARGWFKRTTTPCDFDITKSTWPEMYPVEELRKERDLMEDADPGSFYKEMLCITVGETRIFPRERIWESTFNEWEDKCLFKWGYFDAAAKDGAKNDYQVLLVAGWTGKYIVILDAWIRKAMPEDAIDKSYEIDSEFNHISWMWEEIAFQTLFALCYKLKSAEKGYALRKTLREGALPNKEARIKGLRGMINLESKGGVIVFCMDRGDMKELVDQLFWFPDGDHDDGPDALEGIVYFGQLLGAGIAGGGGFSFSTVGEKRGASGMFDERSAGRGMRRASGF